MLDIQFKVNKFQPVEIIIPAGFTGNQINIQNQASLYNKNVVGLEVYGANEVAFSPISGTATIGNDLLKNLTFEFFQGDLQFANRLPANKLQRMALDGTTPQAFTNDIFLVENWLVSWDKCNLYVYGQPTFATTVCVTLGVYYTDMPNGVRRPVQ